MKKTHAATGEELFTRSVAEVIGHDSIREELLSGKKLRVKFGIDPTSPHIHLGRASALLKLADFQKLGHTIVFIVGDFTGVVGDTSDKESERPMLTPTEVKKNLKTYFAQAGKIIDIKKTEIKKNSAWLAGLRYGEIGLHANAFSVSEFIARENIKRRLDKGMRVSLRELLYPLMQGYDSVFVHADLEIGGTDQRFNMLAGRTLQEGHGQKPQAVMTMNLIRGTDGRKMSSSFGNTINITDKPGDMYGKLMSIPDVFMREYFVSCTRVPMAEVEILLSSVSGGKEYPRDAKMRLAREIVTLIHGAKEATRAEESFVRVFQKRETPKEAEEVFATPGENIGDTLLRAKIISSKNEWHRLVKAGAVRTLPSEEKITDFSLRFSVPLFLKIGKRRFIKISLDHK